MKLLTLLLLLPTTVMAQNNLLPLPNLPEQSANVSVHLAQASINIVYDITRFIGKDKFIEQSYQTSVIPKQNFETKPTENFTIHQTLLPVNNQYFLNYNLQYGIVETSGSLLVEKNKSYLLYRQKGLKIIVTIK